MHSFRGKSAFFNHNSDFSGTVHINVPQEHGLGAIRVEVEGQDLLDLVAEYIRLKKISKLEQMTAEEILDAE